MYNNDYLKRGILVEQKLVEIHSQPGEKKHGKKFVYETYGFDWLGVSDGTFYDHTNTTKYNFGDEKVPLHVEAMLRSLKRNREMAHLYENKRIALSDIPYPEYMDLVDSIREHLKSKSEESEPAEAEKVPEEQD